MRSAIAARLPLFCLLAIAVSGAQALAGIAVDAGPDKAGDSGVPLQLDGAVTGLAPLHFWTADGDDGALWQAEDMIVEWSDETGLAAIGPIQDSSGGSYGWPSDLILIGPTVYGVNTSKEILFSFDPATTLATPIGTPAGGPNWDTWLGSLAYDPGTDAIYSMDWGLAPNRLFVFDRSSETWSVLWSNLPFSNVRGLVWNEQESLLYLADADSGEIHTFDPSDASTQYVVTPGHDPGPALAGSTFQELFYDELEIYDDRLFGTLHARIGGVDYVTLNEIDLVTGGERQHGPTIAESDGHALLIWSMPERVTWRVLSGPGVVSFDSEHEAVTNATFSADGLYELELSVAAPGEPADTVTISMPEPNALAMQAAGAIGIVALGRRRARRSRSTARRR